MNIDKFTQKSIESIQNMEKIAHDYGNQSIEQSHLLMSMLQIEDSLIGNLIEKMGVQLFGAEGMLYFAMACAISYLLSGYRGLYSSQTIMYSKLRAEYINVHTK